MPYLIRSYVNTIKEMIMIANQKYNIYLTPETFYYDRMGNLVEHWLIDPIYDAFRHQISQETSITVEKFMLHA